MKLYANWTSPYVRKVLITAYEKKLMDRIELVGTNPHVDEYLREKNPLCKVPTLELADGDVYVDSTVICEYLDSLSKEKELFPRAGAQRWRTLTKMKVADGVTDALVAYRIELIKDREARSEEWLDRWTKAWMHGLDWIENRMDNHDGVDISHISLACAFILLDYRFPELDWRAGRPRLAEWYEAFKKRPAVAQCTYEELSKRPPSELKEGGQVINNVIAKPQH